MKRFVLFVVAGITLSLSGVSCKKKKHHEEETEVAPNPVAPVAPTPETPPSGEKPSPTKPPAPQNPSQPNPNLGVLDEADQSVIGQWVRPGFSPGNPKDTITIAITKSTFTVSIFCDNGSTTTSGSQSVSSFVMNKDTFAPSHEIRIDASRKNGPNTYEIVCFFNMVQSPRKYWLNPATGSLTFEYGGSTLTFKRL